MKRYTQTKWTVNLSLLFSYLNIEIIAFVAPHPPIPPLLENDSFKLGIIAANLIVIVSGETCNCCILTFNQICKRVKNNSTVEEEQMS